MFPMCRAWQPAAVGCDSCLLRQELLQQPSCGSLQLMRPCMLLHLDAHMSGAWSVWSGLPSPTSASVHSHIANIGGAPWPAGGAPEQPHAGPPPEGATGLVQGPEG